LLWSMLRGETFNLLFFEITVDEHTDDHTSHFTRPLVYSLSID
jgi:hypothetical protein